MPINGDIWYADSAAARATRAALLPASWLYAATAGFRNSMYDRHWLRTHASPITTISVGNLTVGGTGKTPFASYLIARLVAMGRRPALVTRGYGDDETLLHKRHNPAVPIVVDSDRVRGIESAARGGADVVVMDDAFQHRRAERALDIVLVSADRWSARALVLPAGPLRERLVGIRRAQLVVVTRKSVPEARAAEVCAYIARLAPGVTIATASLLPTELVSWRTHEILPLSVLAGAPILSIAGVGDPRSFTDQLGKLGASVSSRVFRDHHAFSVTDARRLALAGARHKYVVTTEKDAVKLGPLWPAKAPTLWYVSQAVELGDSESVIDAALRESLSRGGARSSSPSLPPGTTAETINPLDNGHRPSPFDPQDRPS